jgi:L-ribulose-5-phosphate 4-epimerase
MYGELRRAVLEANLALVKHGLVVMTWGNASAIDRRRGAVAIKPSGVPYEAMTAADIVVVDLAGRTLAGRRRPSSDLPTHLALYRAWPAVGGIVHTHSAHATMFAQANRAIPCLGTTHADHFHGPVPVTRAVSARETAADYEGHTGTVIVERFARLDPRHVPAVLVACHGPFAWGADVRGAVANAVALEEVARLALGTLQLAPETAGLPAHLLARHFARKHGPNATYGQPPGTGERGNRGKEGEKKAEASY